jgi:hypothetical protein
MQPPAQSADVEQNLPASEYGITHSLLLAKQTSLIDPPLSWHVLESIPSAAGVTDGFKTTKNKNTINTTPPIAILLVIIPPKTQDMSHGVGIPHQLLRSHP